MPPTPTTSGGCLGQVDGLVALPPNAGHLLGDIHLQPAGEGQQQGHDVRADVVVVDLPRVGDHHVAFDERLVVIAGARAGLGAGDPLEVVGAFEEFGDDVAEGRVGVADHLHGLADGGADLDVDVGDFLAQQVGPVFLVVGWADNQLECHGFSSAW